MRPNHKTCSFCVHWNDKTECSCNVLDISDCQLIIEKYDEEIMKELMRK